jgi:GDP-4-dehydro-6-deoxy-D-mannose reductase
MRILITGVTGFAGSHLADALLSHADAEVFGTSLTAETPPYWNSLRNRVPLHIGDLLDPDFVKRSLHETQPDQIFHLAGYASAGQSFRDADAAWAGNVTVTQTLLESACSLRSRPRILHVSSGLIYASTDAANHPINEQSPLAPLSPYAKSKEAADRIAGAFARDRGLHIIRVRPFNHIGPRQSPQFAVASFAEQLAQIELGRRPPLLETGDLSAQRDLTDVRDMVQAYIALMQNGAAGEAYNAGSGVAVSMADVLEVLRAECAVPVKVVTAADRLRPVDAGALIADCTKLRAATGWTPRIPLRQSLVDTLNYWREVHRGMGA